MNYVELDYPRNISKFAGVASDIDAVFQWKNGESIFAYYPPSKYIMHLISELHNITYNYFTIVFRQNVLLQGKRFLGIRRPKDEGGPRKTKIVRTGLDGMRARIGNERR